jgi:hypothetical protein
MLDKTGTVNTRLLVHREILQQEQIEIRGISEEVLKVHKVLPGCKEDSITWLLYKNANGLLNRMCGNNKLSKCKDLFEKLGADIVTLNKHRQNLRHMDNCNGWNQ